MSDVRKRARAKLDRILAEHEPEPRAAAAQVELRVILDAAEQELGNLTGWYKAGRFYGQD